MDSHIMRITRLELTPLQLPAAPRKYHSVNPTHLYPDLHYGAPAKTGQRGPGTLVCQVETDEGSRE